MMKKNIVGTYNFTNPGLVSHNEILEMYKEIVDPNFTWNNFSVEEQNAILLSKRSNIQLSTDKLYSLYPDIPDIKSSVEKCIKEYHRE
jgi:3,5-epimerase/4-reductase